MPVTRSTNSRAITGERQGGRCRLLVADAARAGQRCARWAATPPVGDYTALVVEDTGGGITPENLADLGPSSPPRSTGAADRWAGQGWGCRPFMASSSSRAAISSPRASRNPRRASRSISRSTMRPPSRPGPGWRRRLGRRWRPLLVEDEDAVRLVVERADRGLYRYHRATARRAGAVRGPRQRRGRWPTW